MHTNDGLRLATVSLLAVTFSTACGGSDDDAGPNQAGARETGLVLSNSSSFTVSQVFVRTCGAKPWSTDLSETAAATPPNATVHLPLGPGCYDVVAVTDGADGSIRHRHAPGVQVTTGDATRLSLATSEFQPPDASEACAATGEDVDSAVYIVGDLVIMDQMLDPVADAYMRQEFAYQTTFFNLGATTGFYALMDSQGPNAVASPQGFIAFGDQLYSLHGTAHGAAGVQSSLAHEFGHRVQQTLGFFGEDPDYFAVGETVLIVELEADAFAGYYMAHPAGKNAGEGDLAAMFEHFYSFGSDDFRFFEPRWHGTRYQRYASNYIGAQAAYLGYQAGYNYTYQELHDLWIYTIVTDIIQNPSPALRDALPAPTGKVRDAYERLPLEKVRAIARGEPGW